MWLPTTRGVLAAEAHQLARALDGAGGASGPGSGVLSTVTTLTVALEELQKESLDEISVPQVVQVFELAEYMIDELNFTIEQYRTAPMPDQAYVYELANAMFLHSRDFLAQLEESVQTGFNLDYAAFEDPITGVDYQDSTPTLPSTHIDLDIEERNHGGYVCVTSAFRTKHWPRTVYGEAYQSCSGKGYGYHELRASIQRKTVRKWARDTWSTVALGTFRGAVEPRSYISDWEYYSCRPTPKYGFRTLATGYSNYRRLGVTDIGREDGYYCY